MMERRYEAYKDIVVRPFFRDHFARLDRQIVLVDALAAFNAGPDAVHDLEARARRDPRLLPHRAQQRCLERLFRAAHRPHPVRRHQGRPPASREPRPAGGDRCGARQPTRAARARNSPAPTIDVVALAAVRATREATVARGPRQAARRHRHAARRAKAPMARSSTARPKSPPSRATCRPTPKRCSRRRLSRPRQRRPPNQPTSASCASARRLLDRDGDAIRRRCPISGSTAPCSS